jgi:hypothetical protein
MALSYIHILFSSRAVRTHWGHLVRTGVVKRDYKDISINNVITLGTRIRIIVLKVTICPANTFLYLFRPEQLKLCYELISFAPNTPFRFSTST